MLIARHDPHAVLGLHPIDQQRKVIRLFRPDAPSVYLEVAGQIVQAKKSTEEGLFEWEVPAEITPTNYRIYHQNGMLDYDPYAFLPTLGELDLHLFSHGVHYCLYEVMGGRVCEHYGVKGAKFAVWAPNAKGVRSVGDFNFWDGQGKPNEESGKAQGFGELFVPGLKIGDKYKFEI